MDKANVGRSTAYKWWKEFPRRRVSSERYMDMWSELNLLKNQVEEMKRIQSERDIYRDLLLQNNMLKVNRRHLAKDAVRYHGCTIVKACRLLEISEGYYRKPEVS